MKYNTVYTIQFIGFTADEKKIMQSTFSLSERQLNKYALFQKERHDRPHIIIIDFDDTKSVCEWQATCMKYSQYSFIPSVRVSHTKVIETEDYYACRPFTVTQILALLDKIVDEKYSG